MRVSRYASGSLCLERTDGLPLTAEASGLAPDEIACHRGAHQLLYHLRLCSLSPIRYVRWGYGNLPVYRLTSEALTLFAGDAGLPSNPPANNP